jgi:hypothetical protein
MEYVDCEHEFAICPECDAAWLEDRKKLDSMRNAIKEFMDNVGHIDCSPDAWDNLKSFIRCPHHIEGEECSRWKSETCPEGWTRAATRECTLTMEK